MRQLANEVDDFGRARQRVVEGTGERVTARAVLGRRGQCGRIGGIGDVGVFRADILRSRRVGQCLVVGGGSGVIGLRRAPKPRRGDPPIAVANLPLRNDQLGSKRSVVRAEHAARLAEVSRRPRVPVAVRRMPEHLLWRAALDVRVPRVDELRRVADPLVRTEPTLP